MAEAAPENKIIVALDVEELEEAVRIVEALKGSVGAFKIGKQLYTRYGPQVLEMVHQRGGRVFLDLKYHDIPTTVAKASCETARHGVFMFNMHALGGFEMMMQAARATREFSAARDAAAPIMLAVTVLTSHGPEDLKPLGISVKIEDLVIRLARLAQKAGLDGVVASPNEISAVKNACGGGFLVVTPGIRPADSRKNDQKRIMTPEEAVAAGADYLVIGRPVTQSPDPLAAVQAITAKIRA